MAITVKDAIIDLQAQIDAKASNYNKLYSQSSQMNPDDPEYSALQEQMDMNIQFQIHYEEIIFELQQMNSTDECPEHIKMLLTNTEGDSERNEANKTELETKENASDSSTNDLNKENDSVQEEEPYSPFDLRLARAIGNSKDNIVQKMPYSATSKDSAINDFVMTTESFAKSYKGPDKEKFLNALKEKRAALENDPLFQGYSAIINPYAIVRLYGADKSSYLLNQRNQRKFYEVDGSGRNKLGYSLNPNTSSLITWGNDDPYQRTPYSFSDFVFCKYWNVIPNNRLITLRRYAAPILDNLSFPGMEEKIDGEKIMFPPMATAVTYFGENTNNKISDILKFSTGYNWRELKGSVWTVTGEQLDTNKALSGLGTIGGGAAQLASALSIFGAPGEFNLDAVMMDGKEWPDPYEDGPYENRILGPLNRIDTIKSRDAGLNFDMNNLKIVFEYVGRPIGGINAKAAMLDILANFLLLGTGNAVFFGGAHRFKVKPAIYPFPDKAARELYKGEGIKATTEFIREYAGKLSGDTLTGLKDSLSQLLNPEKSTTDNGTTPAPQKTGIGDTINKVIDTIDNSEFFQNYKELGSAFLMGKIGVPFLKGMKAILTGDPVGDWHLTIGNPLNPIALIGNLICKNIEVECNDELGVDDFPTEWKITVNLEHGMPRDKGAIESMFNRGAGRIYELPDNFEKSGANNESKSDQYTGPTRTKSNEGGIALKDNPTAFDTSTGQYGEVKEGNYKSIAVAGDTNSVWNKQNFYSVSSDELNNFNIATISTRSLHSKADWIAKTIK